MGRNRLFSLCLLLACVGLTSCGTGEQVRPRLASSFPENGTLLLGPLAEIRVTYDTPVRLLNPFDVRVISPTRGFIGTEVTQREGEPESVFLRPTSGATFPIEETLSVTIIEGLVVNGADHYAEEPIELSFTTGSETVLLFGRPGLVTLLNPNTFASLGDVPTPGGRDPVGIVSTLNTTLAQRVWVQLASGGGAGDSIAWFEAGDAAMTAIALPSGADLVADAAAITVDGDGRFVYAAFRDTGTQRVRLVRVDTQTAAAAGSLELTAIPATASTAPVDLRWSADGTRLVVAASDGATGTLAFVETETFTEQDRDPVTAGVQGYTLPNGAGRFISFPEAYWVPRAGTSDVDIVLETTGGLLFSAGDETGTNAEILTTPDGQVIIQGLTGYAGNAAWQVRSRPADLLQTFPFELEDDVGGVDRGATSVVAQQILPGIARYGVLLDSPGGLLWARVDYFPVSLLQVDLDEVTDGVQVADVEGVISGATVIGRTFGVFAP